MYLKMVGAKFIILTCYVEPNEIMIINKFQRSRLTFDLSAKVTHIRAPSIYQSIIILETTRQIELKFHMMTPYDKLAKFYTNCFCHMTKMAATLIYG